MKLLRNTLGYIVAAPIGFYFLAYPPFQGMPPWETWFDFMGMLWGMTCLIAFTFFALLFPASFIAGTLNNIKPSTGATAYFALVFTGLLTFYFSDSAHPYWSVCLAIAAISAVLSLIPYGIGLLAGRILAPLISDSFRKS